MPRIRPLFRSFSFRMGMVVLCIISTLLVAQRLLIYFQTIETTYEDIRLIIDAHDEEMDEAMDRYGVTYVKDLLVARAATVHDNHIFLLLKQGGELTGNLKAWPKLKFYGSDYAEVTLPAEGDAEPLHLLVTVSDYPGDTHLLIGHDLTRVDELREDFWPILSENMALALLVSLAISWLIIWLLSRHFRRFNIACEEVMTGNLNYRVYTQHSGDEFDTLADNINRMLEWNKTLINTVKDSSNAIAHDMRTPLSRLRLELRALSERPKLDEETRQHVLEHVERVDNLIEMFENILNIAQAQSRSSTELFEAVDMRQLAQDVIDFYAPIFEEKHLSLHVTLPDAPLMLKGDKQLLGQAVVNLIDNAGKYTPENGALTLHLRNDVGGALLTVADNGEGIPAELLEKVKEPFFRADTSRHTRGHGLGLSLVNAVAALHQGELILEDNAPGLRATLILGSVI